MGMTKRRHSKGSRKSKRRTHKRRHSRKGKGGFLGMRRNKEKKVGFKPINTNQLRQALYQYMKYGKGTNFWWKREKHVLGNPKHWDVSGITNLDDAFGGLDLNQQQTWIYRKDFNLELDGWDVSNVTSMARAFHHCVNFNQPLASWDTSNVTDMREMFLGAKKFNQDISGWNVSKVTNMDRMFEGADAYSYKIPGTNDYTDAAQSRRGYQLPKRRGVGYYGGKYKKKTRRHKKRRHKRHTRK